MNSNMILNLKTVLLIVLLLCGCTCFTTQNAFADALDDDLDEVWTTRDIPAHSGAQLFPTARRFELTLNIGYVPTDDYYNYFPLSMDVHYRFTQMWGLMLRGSLLMLHTTTSLGDFIDEHQSTMDVKYLGDEQRGDISLMATFHPVYGKSTFDTMNLAGFDWGIFAGIGVVVSNSVNHARTEISTQAHAEGVFGTDFHVFFLNWLALRLEASLRFYHAPTQWVVPCSLSVGVSFFLPKF